MATGLLQAETPVPPPPEQLIAARKLMVTSLLQRGFPLEDAEDVAQAVLVRMATNPSAYADKLAQVDRHRPWFATVAMNAYLTLLRGERRRRQRETDHCLVVADATDAVRRHVPGPGELMALADAAGLTAHQRAYLHAVVVDHRMLDDIATAHGTSPRAVRAVLQRAEERLRRYIRTIQDRAGEAC